MTRPSAEEVNAVVKELLSLEQDVRLLVESNRQLEYSRDKWRNRFQFSLSMWLGSLAAQFLPLLWR